MTVSFGPPGARVATRAISKDGRTSRTHFRKS
jgi:hypothetical protein